MLALFLKNGGFYILFVCLFFSFTSSRVRVPSLFFCQPSLMRHRFSFFFSSAKWSYLRSHIPHSFLSITFSFSLF